MFWGCDIALIVVILVRLPQETLLAQTQGAYSTDIERYRTVTSNHSKGMNLSDCSVTFLNPRCSNILFPSISPYLVSMLERQFENDALRFHHRNRLIDEMQCINLYIDYKVKTG